jgi:molecular chaperone DnaJ
MAVTARNLYDVLGVAASADREELRSAFRRLAREHHPDISAAPQADERFREVVEAYRTLSRPTARRMYDLFGHHGLGSEAVEELARWLGARRRPSEPDIVAEVVVDFTEAARGGLQTVEVDSAWTCGGCGGSGAERGSAIERCETCIGSGRLRRSTSLGSGRLLQIETCPACEGSGRRVTRPCPKCSGAGEVNGPRPFDVRIPPGTADGDRIELELDGRDAAAAVAVRVRSLPDAPIVRYLAFALLVAALAFLGFLLLP